MRYKIICPYCFGKMYDDEVLFRSQRISPPEQDILPEEYEDLEDFLARYRGENRESILQQYREWAFFSERDPFDDPQSPYKQFWERFDGFTTEEDANDQFFGFPVYHRPVLDPRDESHQRYMKQQLDGTYFIRGDGGMVTQIELKSGEKCNRRVCRHCHNPLPDGYGRKAVKFLTIVGITRAGKTVYLSQLLRKMSGYAAQVGLDAIVTNVSVSTFLKKNTVAVGKPLPGSTPFKQFQQPLFYEVVRRDANGVRVTETLVMYDVAGELFQLGGAANVDQFAPFIRHADGILVLIDPMQIEVFSEAARNTEDKGEAVTALNAIHTIVTGSNEQVGCEKPVALCLSKIDTQAVQDVLDGELQALLTKKLRPVLDAKGDPQPVFNALDHAPIAEGLRNFMRVNQFDLQHKMDLSYPDHSYFAFTALGCDVADGKPVGPILPQRIEEPIYWMFHKLGYLGTNAVVLPPCPDCGNNEQTWELPESERVLVVRRGFLKKKIPVTWGCRRCGRRW